MRHVLLQLLHALQGSVFGLCILQKGSHVKHVIQVGLDLNLQLIALRVLQFLEKRTQKKGDTVMMRAWQLGTESTGDYLFFQFTARGRSLTLQRPALISPMQRGFTEQADFYSSNGKAIIDCFSVVAVSGVP